MGSTALNAILRRHRKVALDTSIFIYQFEDNPIYKDLTNPVFAWVEHPTHMAITSTITMTELLVPAYRKSGETLVDEYSALLVSYPNLSWIPPDVEVADIAAQIRARHRLRTPDALQAATALHAQATAFITNDLEFRRIEAFETIVLDDLL